MWHPTGRWYIGWHDTYGVIPPHTRLYEVVNIQEGKFTHILLQEEINDTAVKEIEQRNKFIYGQKRGQEMGDSQQKGQETGRIRKQNGSGEPPQAD